VNKLILGGLLTAAMTGLLVPDAHALRNLALKQQGELPRDQYLNLVDPARVFVDKLVVKFVEDTRIRLRNERLVSLEGRSLTGVDAFLKAHPEVQVARLFDVMDEQALDAYVARGEALSGWDVADLNNWYLLTIDGRNADPKGLLEDVLKLDLVQTGYYEPITLPTVCGTDPAPTTPNYEASQGYRDAAPIGVDINYAWAHSSAGDGVESYWFQDLEEGWCEDHEDFDTFTICNGTDSTDPSWYDHGTAACSIVGACDDNKGVTGLVPEVRLTGRVCNNHSSVEAAILATGDYLVTGETYMIEFAAWGPSQGTTCVCNCGQFETIPMEYWSGCFDAILANSNNGRICLAGSANGSMDLDWAGYSGAFNRTVRDSQAILVGAASSDATHDPECWTNHGSRVDLFSWGSNVYAAGYGWAVNPAGCEQDYTNAFSGTSSAVAIAAGTVISLNLIRYSLEGSYSLPLVLRATLSLNGTPQASNFTHEIGVQPNLKGILAPDLLPYTPAGWADTIVPSSVMGTSTLPASLWPAPASTYVDLAWRNSSFFSRAPLARDYLYLDDVLVATDAIDLGRHTAINSQDTPLAVRGGLHYLEQVCDPLAETDESVESNNRDVNAYCWEPVPLTVGTPTDYSHGPRMYPEGAGAAALDGFSNGGDYSGYWEVFGVMPETDADYDIWLFNADPTPTSGWTSPVATSSGITTVDFVGCNNNVLSNGDYAGIVNYGDSSQGYTVEGDHSSYLGAPPSVPTVAANGSLWFGEILDVYEFNVTSLTPFHIALGVEGYGGSADLAAYVYGPATTYFSRGNAAWSLNSVGPGGNEHGVFTPTATGFHALVICKNLRTDLDNYAYYAISWGPPTGDLTHHTLPGWSAPVVARNSGGAVGVVPAILNEGASLGDAGLLNAGSGTMAGGSNLTLSLDGPLVYTSGDFNALASGATGNISGRSIGTVKGGRHTLVSKLDYLGEVQEELPYGESNNIRYDQYAWAPYALTNNVSVTRSAAPNFSQSEEAGYGSFLNWNQDGYLYSTSGWTGVANIPTDPAMQHAMQGYDSASTDPLTAMSQPVLSEYGEPGGITLVMTNGNVVGNGVALNAGVMNTWAWPYATPTGSYVVQAASRAATLVPGVVRNTSLGATQILRCYDIELETGVSYPLRLINNSAVDLGVAIFSAGEDFVSLGQALAEFNSGGAGDDEIGFFSTTSAGRHGVAVYRSGSSDLGPTAAFQLTIGSRQPAAVSGLELHMVDLESMDDYVTFYLDWDDVTTDHNGNPLGVDSYTCYYRGSLDEPWIQFDSTILSQTGEWGVSSIALPRCFFMVTALDADGVLLGGSHELEICPTTTTAAPLSGNGSLTPGLWRVGATPAEAGR
jgi:serine protease